MHIRWSDRIQNHSSRSITIGCGELPCVNGRRSKPQVDLTTCQDSRDGIVAVRIPGIAKLHCATNHRLLRIVLENVRELVGDQSFAGICLRRVSTRTKDNMTADRVCERAHATSGICSASVVVHTYVAKVMFEASFHEATDGRIEWPAWGTQDFVNGLRSRGGGCIECSGRGRPQLDSLVVYGAMCGSVRHVHHGSRDSICLLFTRVGCWTDEKPALQHPQHCLIPQRALECQDGMQRILLLLLQTIRNLRQRHQAALPLRLANEYSRRRFTHGELTQQ